MALGKKKSGTETYEDPIGEFGVKELKIATWYVKNRRLLQKIATGALVAWCAATVSFSVYAWGKYLIFDYFEDREMLARQVIEFPNYTAIQPLYSARNLQFGTTEVFASAAQSYDFVTDVRNPNNRWVAQLNYRYTYTGGQTDALKTVILPNSERPVAFLGHELLNYPTYAKLEVIGVEWRNINPRAVEDVIAHKRERLNFRWENFDFTRAGGQSGLSAHRIQFDLYNDSAYSYWEPDFYVELLDNGRRTGLVYLTVTAFRSGDTRELDLRSLIENLEADSVNLIPLINIYDSYEYMEPGS